MLHLSLRHIYSNPTLPGRHALNVTDEDQVEIDRRTDELIAGAIYNLSLIHI